MPSTALLPNTAKMLSLQQKKDRRPQSGCSCRQVPAQSVAASADCRAQPTHWRRRWHSMPIYSAYASERRFQFTRLMLRPPCVVTTVVRAPLPTWLVHTRRTPVLGAAGREAWPTGVRLLHQAGSARHQSGTRCTATPGVLYHPPTSHIRLLTLDCPPDQRVRLQQADQPCILALDVPQKLLVPVRGGGAVGRQHALRWRPACCPCHSGGGVSVGLHREQVNRYDGSLTVQW